MLGSQLTAQQLYWTALGSLPAPDLPATTCQGVKSPQTKLETLKYEDLVGRYAEAKKESLLSIIIRIQSVVFLSSNDH